ncbi:MAG: helix-turn-helix domain-containing protein [Clostridiales bacterium]|nr:helix-turn-helix domain-containing protein [Clostridiales bacterium]
MENLKILRTKKNLSQQKLADILHISQQSVYKYENDITSPDLETLINMADFFETSVDYIIGHSEISDIIETRNAYDLNAEEEELIKLYRNLSPKQRSAIQQVMKSYNAKY